MRPTRAALLEFRFVADLHIGQKVFVKVQAFGFFNNRLFINEDALTFKVPDGECWQIINDVEGVFVVASSMTLDRVNALPNFATLKEGWLPVERVV